MAVKKPRRLIAAIISSLILTATSTTTAHSATAWADNAHSATAVKSPNSSLLSKDEAFARAKKTGKPVNVDAAETPTTTLTANPDGRFTLQITAQPVRKLVSGKWRPLDATLRKNADGTISPALTTTPLVLSGGGTAPLATMRSGLDSLSLELPARLPVPVLAGSTATYRNVLPGTDLVVTADPQGTFSDVYVIHNTAAAASPRLASLLSVTVTSRGLTVGVDSRGNITARNSKGTVVFGAAAPDLWDSATKQGLTQSGQQGLAQSSILAPGSYAHRGGLTARFAGRTLTLTPDAAVLRGPRTIYPVYLDPSWTGGKVAWSTPSANFPTDSHWNSSAEGQGLMQVGMADTGFWADTLINFSLPLGVLGPEGTSDIIQSAAFYITNVAANNCTPQTVDVYAPSATLTSSNATWNNWFTSGRQLGGAVGSSTFAHGWSSSCPAASVGFGLSTGWIQNDVNAGKSTQTLALAGTSYAAEQFAGNGVGQNDYEVFAPQTSNPVTPALTITFVHAPATPTGLYTSPNAAIIGKGDITLHAPVFDPDGGSLTATFNAYVTGHPSEVITSGTVQAGSGTTAALRIPEATLDGDVTSAAFGGSPSSATLGVSWSVSVTNGTQTATSAVQSFTYDTSTPGAPDIFFDAARADQCIGTTSSSPFTYTAGTPASFYLAPASGQAAPASYSYQLNDGEPVTVPATGGVASATITPTSHTNILTVSALSPGGNVGQPQSCVISAGAPATAAGGDLTGDGLADLLIPGEGTPSLPDGLWLAAGTGGGTVAPDAVNIGLKGTGNNTAQNAQSPAQWDGTQVITGLFQGPGFNGVLDYNPSTNGTAACSGNVFATYGQALSLDPVTGVESNAGSNIFTYQSYDSITQRDTLVCTTSVASGGNLHAAENGATGVTASYGSPTNPDLLLVCDGSLFLEPGENGWPGIGSNDPSLEPTATVDLSDKNPANSGNWDGWTITSTLVNDIPALFAISPGGAVYYYSPTAMATLAYDVLQSKTIPFTAVEVASSGYGSASNVRVQAASFGDGTIGVWTVASGAAAGTLPGQVEASKLTNGTTLTPDSSTSRASLVTAVHNWPLNDQTSGTVGTAGAGDYAATGKLPLTGTGGASWADKDAYFAPDVQLDGVSGDLAAPGNAVDANNSFTVSAWVNPSATGQVLLSQDAGSFAGFTVGTTGTGWYFSINRGSGTSGTFDTISGGTIQLGQWAQVTASYSRNAGIMDLYVDGVLVATGPHTPGGTINGPFHIGSAAGGGSSRANYFAGQVAQVQTWNQALAPVATPSLASYHYSMTPTRIMDTRTGLGGTTGPVAANSVTKLQITGTSGSPLAGVTGVTAVAIDLTVTGGTANGNVTTYADGAQVPITSSTNYGAGGTVTNYQIVPVSPDGRIDLYLSSSGNAQYVVDVTGYFDTTDNAAAAQTYHPVAASRILDTRNGTGAPQAKVPSGSTIALQVTGTDNIPATATAVAINLTATDETGGGYLKAYATGSPAPANGTALSYGSANVASLAGDVPIGTGGKITIANQGGAATDVIGDVLGYYTTDASGLVYHAINPARMVDTRTGVGSGPVLPNGTYTIAGANVQKITTAVSPVLELNLSVTNPTAIGVLTAYPSNPSTTTPPGTSNLNWGPGQTVANSALVPAGTGDEIDIFNGSTGSTQLIVDCSGFFAAN